MEPGRRPGIPLLLILLLISVTAADEIIQSALFEELPAGTHLLNLTTRAGLDDQSPPDQQQPSGVRFEFLNSGSSREELFDLDRVSGELRTAQVIDRDVLCPYTSVCNIDLDIKVMSPFQIIKVRVSLMDINDHAPIFSDRSVERTLPELAEVGTRISLPIANDPDSPQFGISRYVLEGDDSGTFSLQDNAFLDDLQLVLVGPLDREKRDNYNMRVVAVDGGTPPNSGSIDLLVLVVDVNDNIPRFENQTYNITVREDVPLTSAILRVHAVDPDEGINGEVVYGFSDRTEAAHGDKFVMDPSKGDILVIGELDYEVEKSYTLFVTARDKLPNSVPAHAKVYVTVRDLNDVGPEITIKTALEGGALPVLEEAPVGTFVGHIGVQDPDEDGNFTCWLDSPLFELQAMYTTEFKMVTTTVFDREVADTHHVTVSCADHDPLIGRDDPMTTSVAMTVSVRDVNDQRPVFTPSVIAVSIEEGNVAGATVTTVTAHDGDIGDNARITYSLAGDASGIFTIDSVTGEISCNVILDREQTLRMNLTVQATDHGDPRMTGLAVVLIFVTDVDDEVPQFLQGSYEFAVAEGLPVGSSVGRVHAVDYDKPPYDDFRYEIEDADSWVFGVEAESGVVMTTAVLDRETTPRYELSVLARSTSGRHLVSAAKLYIEVTDVNDNVPEIISPAEQNSTIYLDPRRSQSGEVVTTIVAIDRDSGDNTVCEYGFVQGVPDDVLFLHSGNGSLVINSDLQWLEGKQLDLEVIASDCGDPPLNATRRLTLVFRVSPTDTQRKNMIIVIVISVVTVLVALVLVVLILLVVHNRRKLDKKYNWLARMADQRIRVDLSSDKMSGTGSTDEIITSMEPNSPDVSDAVKVALGLGFGLDGVADQRTIEGEEESVPATDATDPKKQIGAGDGLGLVIPSEDGSYLNLNTHPPLQRFVYHMEHTVRKPAVYNPNPDQRPSPAGESESGYSAGDSGRGSAVSEGSPAAQAPWAPVADADNQADLNFSPPPPLPTWDLPPGVHVCDAQRLSSSLARHDSLTTNDTSRTSSSNYSNAGGSRQGYRPVVPPRLPQVRFTLPADVSSLASSYSQSDECLREKDI